MKNKLGFALCLLLAAVFTGCKEDEEGKHHFSNQVFISATSFTDVTISVILKKIYSYSMMTQIIPIVQH